MVQSHPSKYSPPTSIHRPKRYWPACTPTKSPRTSKQYTMLTVPGVATIAPPMLPPFPIGPPSSSRYSSTKSKINGNSAMKHSTAAMTTNTHSSIAHDSTVQAGTVLALDRPILSLPPTTILDLPTTGLEAWIQYTPLHIRCE
jgi:hypothetical protein